MDAMSALSMTRSYWVLLFWFAAWCPGQSKAPEVTNVAPAPSVRFPASWYPADNNVTYTMAAQTDAPYTATLVTTAHYLDPATGELKDTSQSTFQARDAAGRKRDEVEMPRPDGRGGITMAHEVSISDPVSHCSFRWMEPWSGPDKPAATVTCMPRTLHYNSQNTYSDTMVSEPKEVHSLGAVDLSQPLGTRKFGDLEAVGVRRTRTMTNSQTGEVTKSVTEIWYSSELKELLEMKEIPDPKTKEGGSPLPDFDLTQIQRKEPDAALFYPPAGYDIKPE
jgi:hypothetical protein